MIGYNLNGVKFFNPFAAFLHGSIYDPHTFPKFDFYDQEFSTVDWTQEPLESFQALCDQRARQLRNKYDKIILAFTGGTDSITVYNTFVRNHIHIDEITVMYSGLGHEQFTTPAIVSWLMDNHQDKTTKISAKTYQTPSDITKYNQQVLHEDFLVSDQMNLRHQDVKFCVPAMHAENYNQTFANSNYCVIAGFEKPHLVQRQDGYYFRFLDNVFNAVMMREDVELFFISPDLPELHAKQCHMMLNHCIKTNTTLAELEKLENYYLKCAVQGRDPEPLALQGMSQLEKQTTRRHIDLVRSIDFTKEIPSSVISEMLKNQTSIPFASALQQNSSAIKKYIAGWHVLQTDQTLLSYMRRMGLLTLPQQQVQHYHSISSKEYKIK